MSKKKIGVEEDTSIIIKDKDFTEVDEDVLEFFCKTREEPYLRVFLASDSTESFAPPLGRLSAILPVADFNIENGIEDAEMIFEDIGRSMTPSLSTTSSLSTLSNHSVIREEASPESDVLNSIRKSHDLKNSAYEEVSIPPDQTRTQIEHFKTIQAEVSAYNSESENPQKHEVIVMPRICAKY
ncbi:hypothetical protein JTB14_002588 [Gonioctena quinquepunctata]|nr:hypothetical protein JTB14_002588 [Gonioctena quinquepunctata]